MKLFVLISLFSSLCFGMEIKSVQEKNASGVYAITTVLECKDSADTSCQQSCGNAEVCSRPEPVCLNCAGTANELVRILFSRLESYYMPTMDRMHEVELLTYLNTQKYVLLSAESVYNFHKVWGAPETLALFQSYCQFPTEKPLLLVQLDPIGQPQELKAVICQDEKGSYAQKVQARELANQNIEKIETNLK